MFKKSAENKLIKRIILLLFFLSLLSYNSIWAAGTIISDNFDDGIIDYMEKS
jgi:hypothetical protein